MDPLDPLSGSAPDKPEKLRGPTSVINKSDTLRSCRDETLQDEKCLSSQFTGLPDSAIHAYTTYKQCIISQAHLIACMRGMSEWK